MGNGNKPSTLRVEIPWKTILKLLVGVLLAVAAKKVWPLCELLILSILLAIPLYRVVVWAEGRKWPKWSGILMASGILVVLVLGLFALMGPIAIGQGKKFAKELPRYKQELYSHLPPDSPVRKMIEQAGNSGGSDAAKVAAKALKVLEVTAEAALDLVLVIALAIYLMVDGPRMMRWLIAFFPREKRRRVSKGLEEIAGRIVDYIIGQSIVSGLFATYVLVLLTILKVPMAVLLAILAGALDIVPVLGIAAAMTLGTLVALTVSSTTALIAAGCYAAYHVLENYFILPRVYGKKLELSTLAVLVSMIAGGMLAGVLGAVAILPLVAAYPALEKLWLAKRLEPEVVEDHQEQLHAA